MVILKANEEEYEIFREWSNLQFWIIFNGHWTGSKLCSRLIFPFVLESRPKRYTETSPLFTLNHSHVQPALSSCAGLQTPRAKTPTLCGCKEKLGTGLSPLPTVNWDRFSKSRFAGHGNVASNLCTALNLTLWWRRWDCKIMRSLFLLKEIQKKSFNALKR